MSVVQIDDHGMLYVCYTLNFFELLDCQESLVKWNCQKCMVLQFCYLLLDGVRFEETVFLSSWFITQAQCLKFPLKNI